MQTKPLKGPRKVCRPHYFGLPLKGFVLCLLVHATRKRVNIFLDVLLNRAQRIVAFTLYRATLEENNHFLAGIGSDALKCVGYEKGLPMWEALKSIYFMR